MEPRDDAMNEFSSSGKKNISNKIEKRGKNITKYLGIMYS